MPRHAFEVTGAPGLAAVEDIDMELEQRRARAEKVQQVEANLRRGYQQIVEQYLPGFRRKASEFCD